MPIYGLKFSKQKANINEFQQVQVLLPNLRYSLRQRFEAGVLAATPAYCKSALKVARKDEGLHLIREA